MPLSEEEAEERRLEKNAKERERKKRLSDEKKAAKQEAERIAQAKADKRTKQNRESQRRTRARKKQNRAAASQNHMSAPQGGPPPSPFGNNQPNNPFASPSTNPHGGAASFASPSTHAHGGAPFASPSMNPHGGAARPFASPATHPAGGGGLLSPTQTQQQVVHVSRSAQGASRAASLLEKFKARADPTSRAKYEGAQLVIAAGEDNLDIILDSQEITQRNNQRSQDKTVEALQAGHKRTMAELGNIFGVSESSAYASMPEQRDGIPREQLTPLGKENNGPSTKRPGNEESSDPASRAKYEHSQLVIAAGEDHLDNILDAQDITQRGNQQLQDNSVVAMEGIHKRTIAELGNIFGGFGSTPAPMPQQLQLAAPADPTTLHNQMGGVTLSGRVVRLQALAASYSHSPEPRLRAVAFRAQLIIALHQDSMDSILDSQAITQRNTTQAYLAAHEKAHQGIRQAQHRSQQALRESQQQTENGFQGVQQTAQLGVQQTAQGIPGIQPMAQQRIREAVLESQAAARDAIKRMEERTFAALVATFTEAGIAVRVEATTAFASMPERTHTHSTISKRQQFASGQSKQP